MPRFAKTIYLMRAGTFNARASAFCDRPRGQHDLRGEFHPD